MQSVDSQVICQILQAWKCDVNENTTRLSTNQNVPSLKVYQFPLMLSQDRLDEQIEKFLPSDEQTYCYHSQICEYAYYHSTLHLIASDVSIRRCVIQSIKLPQI